MKKIILLSFVLFSICSCKKDTENSGITSKQNQPDKEETILTKIADAYGYENWDNVDKVNFSFVVNPGENESARKWSWKPKTNVVTLHKGEETLTYNRNKIEEKNIQTDKAFVNDSFWFLFPFHLVWDEIKYTTEENFESPLNFEKSTRITVTYPNTGGYTPGDVYQVYVNEDYHIIEWVYYPGGSDESALMNTFEDLTDFDGIKVNMAHKNPQINFQLNFREVSFE